MNKFKILGYFINIENPEEIVIEEKIIESNDTLRYVFNDRSFDKDDNGNYYLINVLAFNIDEPKEKITHVPGMGAFLK